MDPGDVKLSKSLSWLLRHGASKAGLAFGEGGFIDVDRILALEQFKNYTVEDITRVTDSNDKKRFAIRRNKENNKLQIRANQGHSLAVDEEGLLTPLTTETVPSRIYHGTYFRNLISIERDGLKRMTRNHIHFAKKLPGDSGVISGMRKNCDVFLVVDPIKAISDGFKFYESENGVVLCPGNETGVLPARYIVEIWQMLPLMRIK